MRARSFALWASAWLLAAGCQSSPPPESVQPPEASESSTAFDASLAWGHLEKLAAIGPRRMGTDGASRARAYLRGELEALGLEIVEQEVEVSVGDAEPFDLVNLAGRIPGDSEDAIVIAAPYDTMRVDSFEYLGVNEAASGPAVVLEMARVLSGAPLPYTTWIVFLDGEAPLEAGQSPSHFGSRALGRRLATQDVLDQIRLALVISSVCDPELRMARDLQSHRIYREEFWRAGVRLGHPEVFSRKAEFHSADASHRALSEAGLRRVVALVDVSFGGGEPPGVYAGTADDDLEHCSAESLGIVGSVALEALGTISVRLAKIDRFADSPVSEANALAWDTLDEPERPPPPPEAEATSESGAGQQAEPVETIQAAPAEETPQAAQAEETTQANQAEDNPAAGPAEAPDSQSSQ